MVLENHGYDQVIGNPDAPFLNGLTERGALATRYYGITHPSLPNYLALIGGSTFGIDENCTDCSARGSNLGTQLSRSNLSWRAYMEDMPEACYEGDEPSGYAKRHNPFMYFPSISDNPTRCENVVPATQLDEDLSQGALPAFTWVTPNLCNGAHDCGLDVADRWLSSLVPRITANLGEDGFLAITFDENGEDTADPTCCEPGGGRVATFLVGPGVKQGKRLNTTFDHYSLLATIEDRFDLPRLRKARGASALNQAFR